MILMDSAGFCDRQIPVLSTIGKGPRGEKGEKGTVDEQQVMDAVTEFVEEHPEYVTTVEDGAITERKLHDDSVTTPKIADESVTEPKIADGSITIDKLSGDTHMGYIRSFATVEEMVNAEDLVDGMTCHTDGFYEPGDGGAAYYKISETSTRSVDGFVVIGINNEMFANLMTTPVEKMFAVGKGAVATGNYVGRINYHYDVNQSPQGCVLLDDDTLVMSVSNSNTTNDCTLYEVDLRNGVVRNTYTRPWGHCNGATYNRNNDKIYVCPCMDYVNNVPINVIYECNPNDYTIEREIEFPFRPHAIAYDRITKEMYILNFELNGSKFSLYEYNYNTGSTRLCFTRTYTSVSNEIHATTFGGYQEIVAYNGVIYYQLSNAASNHIVMFDLHGDIIGTVNVNSNVGFYSMIEGEGMDMLSDGTPIYIGRCPIFTTSAIAAISYLNFSGKNSIKTGQYQLQNTRWDTRANSDYDVNHMLNPTGSAEFPFGDINEALYVTNNSIGKTLTLAGSNAFTVDVENRINNLVIYAINDNIVVNLESGLSLKNCVIGNRSQVRPITFVKKYSSLGSDIRNCVFRGMNINIPSDAPDSGFAYASGFNVFNKVTVTNESAYSNNLIQGSGGNSLCIENACTGLTFTGFPNFTVHGIS